MEILRTSAKHKDFIALVSELDAYLKVTDGEEHSFYNQFNSLANIKHVVLVYVDKIVVGCGSFKSFQKETVEIKRMYVKPRYRNKGTASKILKELEKWAIELGNTKCVLETGKRQKEAIKFYKKAGYKTIQNYGQYRDMENSSCFEKRLL